MSENREQIKVLFVCMGNICRSPAAEGVFRAFVESSRNENQIYIESAGTLGYHSGDLPDQRMRDAASRRGYKLESRARQVSNSDIKEFDLIVAMDHDNYNYLTTLTSVKSEHVKLLGHFLEPGLSVDNTQAVPDPYYGGGEGFEQVLDMIESACQPMLDYCLEIKQREL